MHALSKLHSELTTHSGLHLGGAPKKPTWQEQTARLFVTRHMLFGPHGDGSHGFGLSANEIFFL